MGVINRRPKGPCQTSLTWPGIDVSRLVKLIHQLVHHVKWLALFLTVSLKVGKFSLSFKKCDSCWTLSCQFGLQIMVHRVLPRQLRQNRKVIAFFQKVGHSGLTLPCSQVLPIEGSYLEFCPFSWSHKPNAICMVGLKARTQCPK